MSRAAPRCELHQRGRIRHETAAALVVHPNTVAYRLAKVERLAGRSLRRPDVRMELHLAVTVHELSGGD